MMQRIHDDALDFISLAPKWLLVALIAVILLDIWNTAQGGLLAVSLTRALGYVAVALLVLLWGTVLYRYLARERKRRLLRDGEQARAAVIRRGN